MARYGDNARIKNLQARVTELEAALRDAINALNCFENPLGVQRALDVLNRSEPECSCILGIPTDAPLPLGRPKTSIRKCPVHGEGAL